MSTPPTAAQRHQNANDSLFSKLMDRDRKARELAQLEKDIDALTNFLAGVQTGEQKQIEAANAAAAPVPELLP